MLRTETWEFVFFLVFVAVCWATAPAVALLHLTNPLASGIALLVAFALGIAIIEWVKKRVMGDAKSRYVAKAVLWTSFGVPPVIFAAQRFAHVELPELTQFAIYLAATALVLGVMAAVMRSPASAAPSETSAQ